jgi:hypothetical protein
MPWTLILAGLLILALGIYLRNENNLFFGVVPSDELEEWKKEVERRAKERFEQNKNSSRRPYQPSWFRDFLNEASEEFRNLGKEPNRDSN